MRTTLFQSSTYPRLAFIEITSWCQKYLVMLSWEMSEPVREAYSVVNGWTRGMSSIDFLQMAYIPPAFFCGNCVPKSLYTRDQFFFLLLCRDQIAVAFWHPDSTAQRCQNWITKAKRVRKKLVWKRVGFFNQRVDPSFTTRCKRVKWLAYL